MAFFAAWLLTVGLAAQGQATCERAPLELEHQATVYVGVAGSRRGYTDAAEDLRKVLRCYPRAFIVVDDSSDADLDLRVLGRGHHPENPVLTHQMGVKAVGRSILPSVFELGGQSWEDCGHRLALRLVQLLSTPIGPQWSEDDAV
jgi:hypothetical protein